MLIVLVLEYVVTRESLTFGKEFSTAAWYLSIWGSGQVLVTAGWSYCRGDNLDWYQSFPLSEELVPKWLQEIMKVSHSPKQAAVVEVAGILKWIGFASLFFNVLISNLHLEALEDILQTKRAIGNVTLRIFLSL